MTIKVALAGAGAFGIKHLDGIKLIEGVEVVSLVGRDLGKTQEVAEHIAGLPPLAVSLTKESIIRGMDISNLQDASLTDAYRFMVLEMSKDKDEAHKAWREKRKPKFTGE